MARGRRRRLRGDRLLRILRPPRRRPLRAAAPGPLRRRAKQPLARSARSGRRHQPLELPPGHLHRHDRCGAGDGQSDDRQAVEPDGRDRSADVRHPLALRRSRQRPATAYRPGLGGRRRFGAARGHGPDRLHRLERSGLGDRRGGRPHGRGTAVAEEGDLRDGREERDRRRRIGRPRRGRPGGPPFRLQLQRAEVLRVQPRRRRRGRLRRLSRPPDRIDPRVGPRRSAGAGHGTSGR